MATLPTTQPHLTEFANHFRGCAQVHFHLGCFDKLPSIHCDPWTEFAQPGGLPPVGCFESPRLTVAGILRCDNRVELSDGLGGNRAAGDDFALVAAAWRRWGEATFARIVGPFSIIVWDSERRRLSAARDPMGRRPLYWSWNGRGFEVATGLNAFAASANLADRLDRAYLAAQLGGQFPVNQRTIFAGIRRVPAGGAVVWDQSGSPTQRRFWQAENVRPFTVQSIEALADEFELRLGKAVDARCPAKGRFAVHVSGGLDSAAVAATAARLHGVERVVAFSAVGDEFLLDDERQHRADFFARWPLTRHEARLHESWPCRAVGIPAASFDQPFVAPYLAQKLTECTLARQLGIAVVLGGEGGDEIGGNSRYIINWISSGRLLKAWREIRDRSRGKGQSQRQMLAFLLFGWLGWHRRRIVPRRVAPPAWLTARAVRETDAFAPRRIMPRTGDYVRDSIIDQIESFPRDPVYDSVHQLAVATGIEYRQPMTDLRLVEWALALEPRLLADNGLLKMPQRIAMKQWLPDALRLRPDKGSYIGHVERALRERERERIVSLLQAPVLGELGLIEPARLRTAYARFLRGGPIDLKQLMAFVHVEDWLRGKLRAG